MADMSESDIQENTISPPHKAQKARHRASVACSGCREKRTRCVIPAGASDCIQCRDAGQECVIKHDDERRKPNSKAYVNSLRDKITHLEALLEEKEQRLAQHEDQDPFPPQFSSLKRDAVSHSEAPPSCSTDSFDFAIPSLPSPPGLPEFEHHEFALNAHSPANSAHSTNSAKSTMVHRLLSTKGHLSFDQLSGRLRYYGPTTNCHVHSELVAENEEHNRQAVEQRRRTQRVLSTLPQETQDYLMEMFWQYYNSVIHIIHETAFKEGLRAGQGQFYSPFLHICILAMGYRHADKSRSDIMKMSLPGRESTLHREAKYMLDYELERPGGVTSVQALLLLGDLECGVGRDNLGWLISGMANRLCFDIGLHLDNSNSGLGQREVEIGRMTLWACVIYDRYWALFLGRPTALKPEDLEVYRLAQQFERLGSLEPAGPSKSVEKQIYEALLDLMELAGKITEIMDKASKPNAQLDHHVYITMAALNRELETWYRRLPHSLQWTADNIEGAPFSYFLLHQQYHAAMILLHRQFAQYDDVAGGSADQGSDAGDFSQASYFATLSRLTCTKSAGRIAQIFWQHRQRYETKKIFVTGLQHAGTAAIALVAALASPKDRVSYDTNMKYLECLAAAINDMEETYTPACRMASVLNAVLEELKAARPPRPYTSTIPARRDSSAERDFDFDSMPSKRHQTSRPGVLRTNSQVQQAPVFLSEHHRRHSTTGMPPPFQSASQLRAKSSKEVPQVSSDMDGFVLMPAEAEQIDPNPSWARFDDSQTFTMDDMLVSTSFGGPVTPSQFRSTWMGAETPAMSPVASQHTAMSFIHSISTSQEPNVFTSTTNLDFMNLLHGSDHMMSDTVERDNTEANTQDSTGVNSLPTPTSQTSSSSAQIKGKSKATKTVSTPRKAQSRNSSQQRPVSQPDQEGAGDKGFSQTMEGLDDIWREMMRTNQPTM